MARLGASMRKMKDCDFQWIGQIPEDWMMTKVKFVADFYNGDRGKNYPSGDDLVDDGIVFLTSNNIHSTVLDTNPEITKYITPERYKLLGGAKIKKGDLVFCLRGSIGLCSINESEDEGTVASSLTVLRPKNINNHFLNFILNSKIAEIQTKKFENGSCAANLSAENVGTYIIPYPPLVEQQKIAVFLDEKCGEIDSIRSDIQKQIDILNDYKKSVITEAVTKGLNPKAKLKDSGIEWIGKIPEHWETIKVGYCFSFSSGDTLTSESIEDDGDYVVYGANGIRGYYSYSNLNGEHILIGRVGALCGNIHITHGKVWVTEHALIARKKRQLDENFYGYVFEAMDLGQYSKASAQPVISSETLSALKFIEPSLEEQQAIADYLDEKCSAIDATIADKQKQLETLDEYKKSLIFEYVTGKKEVLQ